jgi:chloride channel 3/4/5
MTSGARGRSKTQKVCLSSTPDAAPHVHTAGGRIASSAATPGGTVRPKNLGRIKLLSNIETRSPIIKRHGAGAPAAANASPLAATSVVTPLLDRFDLNELESVNSNLLLSLRLLGAAPQSLYTLRNYYNDFTTIDWVQAFIAKNRFNFEVQQRNWIVEADDGRVTHKIPVYYKAYLRLGIWVLIVSIAFGFSLIAYAIDRIEIVLVGFKHGYCRTNWLASLVTCCDETVGCSDWVSWSEIFGHTALHRAVPVDFLIYVVLTLGLASLACVITLSTKITSGIAHPRPVASEASSDESFAPPQTSTRTVYTASGLGVPEVKTILSGFFIRRFLGTYTLVAKTVALVLAIALGMALGKEGPYVHLATCVGNIMTRMYPYIDRNDLMTKQVLTASALSGVALAFGSPLGSVLFILEEINNYLPTNQLFQIFFCAITLTLFLKFLDPYGTGNTVLFELQYTSDWRFVDLGLFVVIGVFGGVFGALFIKFVHWWSRHFRSSRVIRNSPILEVFLVALLTGTVTFWNPYTKQASTELMLDLATPCNPGAKLPLCTLDSAAFVHELWLLMFALCTKIVLTFITFGLKVPCGIYVPSMVVGSLFGRIFGMLLHLGGYNVDLGIYSMISAGAFMAGVTRMNITLVTILFELTSSYTYVLPIAIAISVANWLGGLIEKNSLYESLLILNDYPFMSSETEPLDPLVTAADIINDSDTYLPQGQVGATRYADRGSSSPGPGAYQPHILHDQKSDHHINSDTQAAFHRQPAYGNPKAWMLNINEYFPHQGFNDHRKLFIDVSSSPYVAVSVLQSKLVLLAEKSLLDGCIPLILNDVCVGLIFFSELECCLDKLESFCLRHAITEEIYCRLLSDAKFGNRYSADQINAMTQRNQTVISNALHHHLEPTDYFSYQSTSELHQELLQLFYDLIDLTDSLDFHPIFINFDSELTLAHLIFDRVGNRVLVLLKDGAYYGVLHKKVLIDYCRQEDLHR